MKFNNYSAPEMERVSLEEAALLADSFSNGEPIVGPTWLDEGDLYYDE